jgi:hypothetical protein
MTAFNQSWTDRAFTRGAGMEFFTPPLEQKTHRRWHVVETHVGLRRVQWRPGIERWHGEAGESWTAESCHRLGWTYVEVAANQRGGLP